MSLTKTVFVRVCPSDPETSAPSCFWQEVDSSVLTAGMPWTQQQMGEAINAVIMIFTIIFIVAMIKKAIEQ